MTIHADEVRKALAMRDEAPVVHRITLTKDDVVGALCTRACQRLGIDGSFTTIIRLNNKPDGELESVEMELVPRPFIEGAPTEFIWPLETNAQRIERETPQWSKDICSKAVAEATARCELDELNQAVTAAIFHAERLPPGDEAALAFREVSRLEEEIARITTPDKLQGAVARRGAVTAALSAGDWLRAMKLANDYLAQSPPADLEKQLVALLDEAMSAAQSSGYT